MWFYDLLHVVSDNYEPVMSTLWDFMHCYEHIMECYDASELLHVSYNLFYVLL